MFSNSKLLFDKLLVLCLIFTIVICGCSQGAQSQTIDKETLRIGWTSEPDTLNPLTTISTEALQVLGLVYEPLLAYGTNLETIYKLAESYTYSDDGLVVTYKLRSGVKWHDGEPFTSEDVVSTYNLIKDTGIGQYYQYMEFLEDVSGPDDLTVVMTFSEPQAFNMAQAVLILPKHIWGEMTAEEIEMFSNDAPIGTGAFTFSEWRQGSTVTLKRFDDYYGEPAGPGQIIFVLYGNEDVMAQALKGNEIDIITEVSPLVWEGLQNTENIKAVSLPSFSFHHIGINVCGDETSLGNPFLKDKAVRQALSYALDREQLVNIALAGHGSPGASIIPAGMMEWQYIPDEQMDADLDKANELLDEAGYMDTNEDGIREKNGVPLVFRIMAIESTTVDVRAVQLFRDSAKKAGIKLELSTVDENTLAGVVYNVDAPDWDLFVWGWDSDYPDPGYLLGVPLTSQIGNNNDVFYSNPEYDALYSQQSTEVDRAKRKIVTDEMQKNIL